MQSDANPNQRLGKKGKQVHKVTEQDCDEYIMNVTTTEMLTKTGNRQLFAGMLVGKELKFQIDYGASCNIISINLLNPDSQKEHTKKVLVMYTKTKLHPLGKCKMKVRNPRNQKMYCIEFVVVNEDCRLPLLAKGK